MLPSGADGQRQQRRTQRQRTEVYTLCTTSSPGPGGCTYWSFTISSWLVFFITTALPALPTLPMGAAILEGRGVANEHAIQRRGATSSRQAAIVQLATPSALHAMTGAAASAYGVGGSTRLLHTGHESDDSSQRSMHAAWNCGACHVSACRRGARSRALSRAPGASKAASEASARPLGLPGTPRR